MAFGAQGTAFIDQVTDISATQLYPMRTRRHENGVDYIYVQADDAITQYHACSIDFAASTTGNKVRPATDTTDFVQGVAQVAVTDEYYFWLATRGVVTCIIGATAVAGNPLSATAADGVLDLGGANDARVHVCGVALQNGAAGPVSKLIQLGM
jgi:hypothetical protein